MEQLLIGFGSNLGDRTVALRAALHSLSCVPGLRLLAQSALYETEPIADLPQGLFLNACALFECNLPPQIVLAHLQGLEARHGRTRSQVGAPRTLDLDLLLQGERCMATASLVVPHPRMRERGFVLIPAAEIAPKMVHPQSGKTMLQLRHELPADCGVRRFGEWVEAEASG
ncbi:MAG: 2-amino-4-hydroxy-6-hydroxymethyldihydropteridine diphosphokinase [Planctomycetes bacterium]|nr:2-amino-4-hydroxy-6-hydroxymethyldihydropteridine diphosphokinase [Planctomycetota bacterium]